MGISPKLQIFQTVASIPVLEDKNSYLVNHLRSRQAKAQGFGGDKNFLLAKKKQKEKEIEELPFQKYRAFQDDIEEFETCCMLHYMRGDQSERVLAKNAVKTKQEIMCRN